MTTPPIKIATWNVNSVKARLTHLLDWLDLAAPTVVLLQELKCQDADFPRLELESRGWHVATRGQKTYNGVALLSRTPLTDVQRNIPGFDDDQARVIAATTESGVRVVGAYFPNGQAPDSDKFAYKMRWLDALRQWLGGELQRHSRLVLLGDFNIAPEDRDVYDPVLLAGQIHCTPEERKQFQQLLDLGLFDAFRAFEQPEKSWSWWDYRNLAFRRNRGLRIDHILASNAMRPALQSCSIDKEPRRAERASDHAPVIATFAD